MTDEFQFYDSDFAFFVKSDENSGTYELRSANVHFDKERAEQIILMIRKLPEILTRFKKQDEKILAFREAFKNICPLN